MSPNKDFPTHSPLNPNLKTPLKASVVMITTLVLASCSSTNGAKSYTLDEIFGKTPVVMPESPTETEDTVPASVSSNYADGVVSGIVTNDAGEPVANAPVTITLPNGDTKTSTTNDNGEYSVDLSDYEFAVGDNAVQVKAGEATSSETVTVQEPVTPPTAPEPDVTPSSVSSNYADGTLSGVVTNETGDVLANSEVTVTLPDSSIRTVTTNDKGEYSVDLSDYAFATGDNNIQVKAGDATTSEVVTVAEPVTPPTTPEPPAYASAAESVKSGVQTIALAGKDVLTRNFNISDVNSVDANVNEATNLVSSPVPLVIGSGQSDTFTTYQGTGIVPTSFGNADFNYDSVYKDFGSSMRVGHIVGIADLSGTQIPVDGAFVVGNRTETLPSEGEFTYVGDATYKKIGPGNDIEYGASNSVANFVDGTVVSNLTGLSVGDITLNSQINGSDFSGDAGQDYETEGSFYGENAEFLGGVYKNAGAQGTYGGKKQ